MRLDSAALRRDPRAVRPTFEACFLLQTVSAVVNHAGAALGKLRLQEIRHGDAGAEQGASSFPRRAAIGPSSKA